MVVFIALVVVVMVGFVFVGFIFVVVVMVGFVFVGFIFGIMVMVGFVFVVMVMVFGVFVGFGLFVMVMVFGVLIMVMTMFKRLPCGLRLRRHGDGVRLFESVGFGLFVMVMVFTGVLIGDGGDLNAKGISSKTICAPPVQARAGKLLFEVRSISLVHFP